ncbi:VF530 family DNA-binding protein [Colwellia sp. E150_009]
MGELLNILCFMNKPHLKSSLKFLRTTPWTRSRV